VKQISNILDKTCANCEIRKQREKEYGSQGRYSTADSYCLHECHVGQELKNLGNQLGKGARKDITNPRRERRAIVLEEVVG